EFKFNGPSGENTVVINLPPGKHKNIDVRARWKTNGIEGQEDHKIGEVTCVAEPAFSIEKLQRIENESNYTTNELGAVVGQTVEYKIVVKNTGNTSIKFSELSDAKCEGISPSGEVEVGSGGEQVYTCSHVLLSAGKYGNTATITGAEETKTSNEVVVEVTF